MLRATLLYVLLSTATAQGWVDRTPVTGPVPRQYHAMCYDAARGYVMMAGGNQNQGTLLDVYTWNGTSWTRRQTPGTPASNGWANDRIGLAYHAATQQVVLVHDTASYTWDGTDWTPRGQIFAGSFAGVNNARSPFVVAYDAPRNQTVLFASSIMLQGNVVYAQTFVWDGLAWSLRSPAVRPLGDAAGMAFDPASNRLLLATNVNGSSWFWEWTGTNWQQRFYSAATVPGPMATDSAHGKVVMFDAAMNSTPLHTWTLANGQSTQAAVTTEPARRANAAMAFDPARGRCVLFGGGYGQTTGNFPYWIELGDTWEFELGAGASYTTFGTGCVGSRGAPTLAAATGSTPRIGQTFQAHVGNLPFTGPVFLFIGISGTTYGPTPLPFALDGLGAPGCAVRSSGEDLALLTNVLGSALWQWTVPNAPGVSFYNQAFAFDPAANALGITTSNAAQGTIGF